MSRACIVRWNDTLSKKNNTLRQVVHKDLEVNELWRDTHVSALFLESRLERRHTHRLLQTLCAQVEHYVPTPVSRSVLDLDKNAIMPVASGEKRVVLPSGRAVVVTRASKLVRPAVCTLFNVTDYLFVSHTVDRGPTNVAALHFMMSRPCLWSVFWGPHHDIWNAVKTAAKGVPAWWQEVVRFAAICNLNYGPFRTGAWGRWKQNGLKEVVALVGPNHPRFRELALKQMILWGHVDTSDEGFQHVFNWFSRLPSANLAGPILKFSRWRSIIDSWDWYEPEVWLLKFLLEELRPEAAIDALAHGRLANIIEFRGCPISFSCSKRIKWQKSVACLI